jgi:hypothetical protein
MKTNLFLMHFSTLIANMLLELLTVIHRFCVATFWNAILANLAFCHATGMFQIWPKHNSLHFTQNPITDIQTAQAHRCTDIKQTNSKFCPRNTALLVVWRTAL